MKNFEPTSKGEESHDRTTNELRKRFKTYEEGVQEFIYWHEGLAHDIGGYSPEDEEIDRARFREMWNSTEDVKMPTIW